MVAGINLVALRAVCVKRRSKLILGPVSLEFEREWVNHRFFRAKWCWKNYLP